MHVCELKQAVNDTIADVAMYTARLLYVHMQQTLHDFTGSHYYIWL